MPEENFLIENETVHVKVFRAPTRKPFQKKLIFTTVVAILTLIVIGGLIIWTTHLDQTGVSDKSQHQYTAAEIKLKKSNLLHYLNQISGSKTISGIRVKDVAATSYEGVQLIRRIALVSPGLISTDMPGYNYDETVWTSFIAGVISNWNDHHLVRIVLWDHPIDGVHTNNSHEIIGEDLIIDGGQFNNVWMEHLDKIAPHLHKLQNSGVIPIFDFFPLLNWEYGKWRGRPGVNGTAKLYKITHDYLTKRQNLTSLIWNWSMGLFSINNQLTQFEQFWPGRDYVDAASVYMFGNKNLSIFDYQRLVNLVGDKPVSMDYIDTVPSVELLKNQPRWIWFSVVDTHLNHTDYNSDQNIKATFHSVSVINKGSIDFFNDSDLTIQTMLNSLFLDYKSNLYHTLLKTFIKQM